MSRSTLRGILTATLAAAAALTIAGCASGPAAPSGSAATADVAAAKAFIEPYTKVTSFPVTEPLAQPLSPDSSVVFLDVGTDVAALQGAALKEAVDTMGAKLTIVPTGQTPLEITNALDSVVQLRPDVLIAVAIDPQLWSSQLDQLRANGTEVVASAIINGEQFGFGSAVMSGKDDAVLVGEIMAADMIVKDDGASTDFAFYTTPELAFTAAVQEGAEKKIAELCPGCTLRVVEIPITELGSTAPQTIVSDLQANPRTGGMIMAFDQLQLGLPAALQVAGIDIPGIGWAPTVPNLQAISEGRQYAGIGLDLPVQMWSLLDQAARQKAGQPLSGDQELGLTVKQIVVRDNVPADYSAGWSGYPDYRERFAALWSR